MTNYRNDSKYNLDYAIQNGRKLDKIYFWSGTPFSKTKIDESCFSNWFRMSFSKDGYEFKTMEHYMMFQKAMVFDTTMLESILKAPSPKEAKRLGRLVDNFDGEIWADGAMKIVEDGLFYKFISNHGIKNFLLDTEESLIVEASPFDRIWGIGMGSGERGVDDPFNWKGQNVLGFALMNVRDRIKEYEK